MLSIVDLYASVNDQLILKGLNLQINPGEVHAIMGPNGSGKSTLAQVLAGHENYTVDETRGSVVFQGEDLLALSPEERARQGLFLAFQYPVEIQGITNSSFLQTALNEIRKSRGEEEMDALDFAQFLKKKMELVEMQEDFAERFVNFGFSGGEKKRNEILQLAVLEPALAILDETDSGLDIDALRTVASGVNRLRSPQRSFLLITHYQRLLDYIQPDFVHVLYDGKLIQSGGKELALKLEEQGYNWIREAEETLPA
ncbi:MAG TPA: Fe-S cluster assembly ATPase SufC [Candidatus Hydrogenedentes bacterium]|jgi:Fe-S cluster assembly ATP-binding protein|nr:MAG: putative ATP-dependent transporter SufC [Candidatus Hydrogenedentes bacterium ADurb.Bin170]HOD94266.1 Fe-S cluster assembly ATPase SufC [Candidatus Hydrogenedentota bacterium]HOM47242.1 Fe-S cluster assembly ATPase SufC [Candidatus Hydrogenedentota bacterium]HOR50616.1 Fe-S cluster assembly ATPase SufC [Candidatus Hydrogenedentota bacterium]HPK23696.1 Fe-S cluster assembly ATPase SufC [Candidatus Hydrogenedentota bacterium]